MVVLSTVLERVVHFVILAFVSRVAMLEGWMVGTRYVCGELSAFQESNPMILCSLARNGKPIRDFRGIRACVSAGLSRMLPPECNERAN